MANMFYDENAIQDIANAIRTINGSSTTYKISEMAAAISVMIELHKASIAGTATDSSLYSTSVSLSLNDTVLQTTTISSSGSFSFNNITEIGTYTITSGSSTAEIDITADDIYNCSSVAVELSGKKVTVNLHPGVTSYGWAAATVTNPTSYTMYQSHGNYNVSSSYAVMKVTIKGYSSFTIYINSYAESSYDYTVASTLDAASFPTSSSGTYAYANTSGKQYTPTTFSTTNWTTVTYTLSDTGEHYFYIVYLKDDSVNSNNDRGYVLINMNQ